MTFSVPRQRSLSDSTAARRAVRRITIRVDLRLPAFEAIISASPTLRKRCCCCRCRRRAYWRGQSPQTSRCHCAAGADIVESVLHWRIAFSSMRWQPMFCPLLASRFFRPHQESALLQKFTLEQIRGHWVSRWFKSTWLLTRSVQALRRAWTPGKQRQLQSACSVFAFNPVACAGVDPGNGLAPSGAEPASRKSIGSRAVVTRLVDARLLVADRRSGADIVDVAHESLLRQWPALTEWLKADAADLHWSIRSSAPQ